MYTVELLAKYREYNLLSEKRYEIPTVHKENKLPLRFIAMVLDI